MHIKNNYNFYHHDYFDKFLFLVQFSGWITTSVFGIDDIRMVDSPGSGVICSDVLPKFLHGHTTGT